MICTQCTWPAWWNLNRKTNLTTPVHTMPLPCFDSLKVLVLFKTNDHQDWWWKLHRCNSIAADHLFICFCNGRTSAFFPWCFMILWQIGMTPLACAASQGHIEIAGLLILNGAKMHTVDLVQSTDQDLTFLMFEDVMSRSCATIVFHLCAQHSREFRQPYKLNFILLRMVIFNLHLLVINAYRSSKSTMVFQTSS